MLALPPRPRRVIGRSAVTICAVLPESLINPRSPRWLLSGRRPWLPRLVVRVHPHAMGERFKRRTNVAAMSYTENIYSLDYRIIIVKYLVIQ